MPHIRGPIIPGRGPICKVIVSVNAAVTQSLRSQGKTVPQISLQCLLDSGADGTIIDISHLSFLDPQNAPLVNVTGLYGVVLSQPEFEVGLTIAHPSGNRRLHLTRPTFRIVHTALDVTLGFQAIIGRDLLDNCLLVYDGPNRTYLLGW